MPDFLSNIHIIFLKFNYVKPTCASNSRSNGLSLHVDLPLAGFFKLYKNNNQPLKGCWIENGALFLPALLLRAGLSADRRLAILDLHESGAVCTKECLQLRVASFLCGLDIYNHALTAPHFLNLGPVEDLPRRSFTSSERFSHYHGTQSTGKFSCQLLLK